MPDIALGRFALNPTTGEPARTVYPRRALCPSSSAPGRVTVASGSGLERARIAYPVGLSDRFHRVTRVVDGEIPFFPYTQIGRLTKRQPDRARSQ